MKKILLLLVLAITVLSCKKDEARNCTTCSSPETTQFEVCRESDGNASVNGQNTGTDYDVYINGLEETGVNCGG